MMQISLGKLRSLVKNSVKAELQELSESPREAETFIDDNTKQNPAKRAYAHAYFEWLNSDKKDKEPQAKQFGCNETAAFAARSWLDALYTLD